MDRHITETVKKQSKNLFFRIVFSRVTITVIMLIVQILTLFSVFSWLKSYLNYFLGAFIALSFGLIVYIINCEDKPEFKLAWMLPVCGIPVFGVMFYIFIKANPGMSELQKRLDKTLEDTKAYLQTDKKLKKEIQMKERDLVDLSYFIQHTAGYPTYKNTDVSYYPLGEAMFEALKEELEKAKYFIFLEYFIIEEGVMWNTILEILKRKVQEGVEVRVMYDGMGCLMTLPSNYPKKLEKLGIKAKIYAPLKPLLSTHQNNRDHRKIAVIDGRVGFNGGINLSDEYINEKILYGHWKDVAVKLTGDAVKNLTAMFLQIWNVKEGETENYGQYLSVETRDVAIKAKDFSGAKDFSPARIMSMEEKDLERGLENHITEVDRGYVIPYGDVPTDHEDVAEEIYKDILNQAHDYVHIMSPYLIIDGEMLVALTHAAKRGIDVKLILPHIPDKKVPNWIAKTYYKSLIKAGVKIYEYTPGFVHAKVFIADDIKAIVGTINLDYRSLYHHFECATLMYKHPVIEKIEEDFQDTLEKSQLITLEIYKKFKLMHRLAGKIFRIFAPLL